MLRFFNTLGRKIETFHPVSREVVNIFTCGPSVYQRSHIGNFRTFLFEDILVRYLEYSGYKVRRGMNLTDIEDKALEEAEKERTSVTELSGRHIRELMREMRLLKIREPDFLPKASESVPEAVAIISRLLAQGNAYRYRGDIYFDPLTTPRFGELFGLDMRKWPKRKVRFRKDTYPGMRWNFGDFILWHECRRKDSVCWDTGIGRGWPSWNIQDPSMIIRYFNETLSVYCGGIDNLYRHHDYSKAILESLRPYPMARFWLHCRHLHVNGQKMSKSKGNILYTDTLREKGYTADEIRFFLIYGHYRADLDYSDAVMRSTADRLKKIRNMVRKIGRKAGRSARVRTGPAAELRHAFSEGMDNDLDVKGAFDRFSEVLFGIGPDKLSPGEALEIIRGIRAIDGVLRVLL